MKKLLALSFILFMFGLNAQKKKNGNIYIEHPNIQIVEKFNTAFISGDNETLKNMLSEDFKWFTPSDRTPRNLSQLLSTSTYLSNNVINLEIKHRGGSYPDVLEYDQDGISDVKTYERMSGYDKNTGVDLTMPRYATFRINKQGKIIRMWVNDDQLLWKKAREAYGTRKNGVIYKDHPFISNIRLMISGLKEMDVEKIRSYYSENAFKAFEIVYLEEIGYPDALAYEGGNVVIISWLKMIIKNKKSGKTGTVMQHLQHTLNEEGKIIREDYYYNPSQFPQ
jgi:hypothetical protein